jgi:hypothetical protein
VSAAQPIRVERIRLARGARAARVECAKDVAQVHASRHVTRSVLCVHCVRVLCLCAMYARVVCARAWCVRACVSQVKEYLGEEERTLVDFILRMLAEHRPPNDILAEVKGGEREKEAVFSEGGGGGGKRDKRGGQEGATDSSERG